MENKIQKTKKLILPSELAFIVGIVLLSIGVILLTKADYGISVVQSPAYVLSNKFEKISFGLANYIIQIVLLLVIIICTRKFSIKYIFAFINAFIYSLCLDGFNALLKNASATNVGTRLLFFVIGFFLVVFAVILFFRTNIPLMPYDIFVKELATIKNYNIAKTKLIFDLCCLLTAVILTLILNKRLLGIGIGTVICGVFTGIFIGIIGKLFDKVITFKPIIKSKNASKTCIDYDVDIHNNNSKNS